MTITGLSTKLALAAGLALTVVACSGSGGGSDDTDGGTTTDGTTGTSGDTGGSTGEGFWEGETAGDGEACSRHGDCQSFYCLEFQDAPEDPSATCEAATPIGTMRVTGRVMDIMTGQNVGGASFDVKSALGAATNPVAAQSLGNIVTDGGGVFDDEVTDIDGNPIGIVAITQADGYYLTATGLASPHESSTDYLPGNDIHDLWVIEESVLTDWSGLLAGDAELEGFLPLGEAGGIIGLVRASDGSPVAGATVQSEDTNNTVAIIRYLSDDGMSFNSDATGTSGIFVIVSPGLGENFEAYLDGEYLGRGTGGSANGVAFTLII